MPKGLGSSHPPLSANQSLHFAYILEKLGNPRGTWGSFCPQRTRESRLTPDLSDSASILSVRSKNGSLQRLNALWAAFAQPSASAPNPQSIRRLLQRDPHPSVARQRRSKHSTLTDSWCDRCDADPRWTPSSICSDLVLTMDRRLGKYQAAIIASACGAIEACERLTSRQTA
jgi:hypothetical protein